MQDQRAIVVETAKSQQPSLARSLGVAAVVTALSTAYLLFVVHYSVNELFADEWNVVPMVDAAFHNHLSITALWAQHGENRMLVPNILFVGLGVATRFDTRADVVLSALVYVASFTVFLAIFRSYLHRSLTVLSVCATGVVWFGLQDWEKFTLWIPTRLVSDRSLPYVDAVSPAGIGSLGRCSSGYCMCVHRFILLLPRTRALARRTHLPVLDQWRESENSSLGRCGHCGHRHLLLELHIPPHRLWR